MKAVVMSAAVALLCSQAQAEGLSPEQAASIYSMAHSVSKLPLPDRPPVIHIATQESMRAVACPGKDCVVLGYQKADSVFISDTLDMADPFNATILLHEFVHYLQWAAWGPAKTCEENLVREIQAYDVQNQVLRQIGSPRHVGAQIGTCA